MNIQFSTTTTKYCWLFLSDCADMMFQTVYNDNFYRTVHFVPVSVILIRFQGADCSRKMELGVGQETFNNNIHICMHAWQTCLCTHAHTLALSHTHTHTHTHTQNNV